MTDNIITSNAWFCTNCGPITNVNTAVRPTCQGCGGLLDTHE